MGCRRKVKETKININICDTFILSRSVTRAEMVEKKNHIKTDNKDNKAENITFG